MYLHSVFVGCNSSNRNWSAPQNLNCLANSELSHILNQILVLILRPYNSLSSFNNIKNVAQAQDNMIISFIKRTDYFFQRNQTNLLESPTTAIVICRFVSAIILLKLSYIFIIKSQCLNYIYKKQWHILVCGIVNYLTRREKCYYIVA